MNELASSMESTYSTAKICKYGEDLSSCIPTLSLGGKMKSIKVRYKILALETSFSYLSYIKNIYKRIFYRYFKHDGKK